MLEAEGLPTLVLDGDGWAYCQIPPQYFSAEGDTIQVYVKETEAPTEYYVQSGLIRGNVNNVDNATQDTAAVVGPTTGFCNGDETKGDTKKANAETGAGIGPAVFRFVGEAGEQGGGHVDTVLWTDATGSLNIHMFPAVSTRSLRSKHRPVM